MRYKVISLDCTPTYEITDYKYYTFQIPDPKKPPTFSSSNKLSRHNPENKCRFLDGSFISDEIVLRDSSTLSAPVMEKVDWGLPL